jgi:hypothetical protein
MATQGIIQSVTHRLFGDDGMSVYAVLDGAAIPNLLDELYELESEFACLYRGELEPDIAQVAPYLVQLDDEPDFTEWLIEEGWGKHWGIFALSDVDLRTMRKHFRRFLTVYDPDGKPMLFRYYDPRVLRLYLPTCTSEELTTVFGPIEWFLLEDDDPNKFLHFHLANGAMRQESLAFDKNAK